MLKEKIPQNSAFSRVKQSHALLQLLNEKSATALQLAETLKAQLWAAYVREETQGLAHTWNLDVLDDRKSHLNPHDNDASLATAAAADWGERVEFGAKTISCAEANFLLRSNAENILFVNYVQSAAHLVVSKRNVINVTADLTFRPDEQFYFDKRFAYSRIFYTFNRLTVPNLQKRAFFRRFFTPDAKQPASFGAAVEPIELEGCVREVELFAARCEVERLSSSFGSLSMNECDAAPTAPPLPPKPSFLKAISSFCAEPLPISKFAIDPQHKEHFEFAPGEAVFGLKNLGNTCYMNCVLQCLASSASLYAYFKRQNFAPKQRLAAAFGAFLTAAAAKAASRGKNQLCAVSPHALRSVFLAERGASFDDGGQHDAHDFMLQFADALHDELKGDCTPPAAPPALNPDNVQSVEAAWKRFFQRNASIVTELFYGMSRSTMKCLQCFGTSDTFDAIAGIEVGILPRQSVCTLADCIDAYFTDEILRDAWKCPKCQSTAAASKSTALVKLPAYFVVQLKRFCVDAAGNTAKVHIGVRVPLAIDIPAVDAECYTLYAVVEHHGDGLASGHYTAKFKRAAGEWFEADDSSVWRIDEDAVLADTRSIYLLFFERKIRSVS